MKRPVPTRSERIRHWAFVVLFVAAAVVFARLVVLNALDKGIHMPDRIGLIVMGLAVFVLLWRIFPDFKGLVSGKASVVKDRKASENAFILLLTMLGLLPAAIALMAPRPAIEDEPGLLEKAVLVILRGTQKIDATTTATKRDTEAIKQQLGIDNIAFAQKISGIWGEKPDCAVTYRFAVLNNALVVDSVKNAAGMAPYHWEGTLGGVTGNVLMTATLGDGADQGMAVSFTYTKDGTFEMLIRTDRSRPIPLELKRCSPPAPATSK